MHYSAKGPYNQSYGFSSSMWELDHKEGWAPKDWGFQIVVLEKMLESPLGCKEVKSVNPKGNQSQIFFGSTDAEAEALILWTLDAKNWLIGEDSDAGKDWGQGDDRRWDGWEDKGTIDDEMAGWYHQLNGPEFE